MPNTKWIAAQLSKYHGSVSEIADSLQCSTDKVYRVLRGIQQKDKETILIACSDYIMRKRQLQRVANDKMAALTE